MYEVFDHTADIGLRVRAATLDELFRDAAQGFFSLIVANLDDVQPREQLDFTVPIRDRQFDLLIFDWLNELLFTFDSRQLVMSKFDVHISADALHATAWGEPLNQARHQLEHEVKAITYHGLVLKQEPAGWIAEVILDI